MGIFSSKPQEQEEPEQPEYMTNQSLVSIVLCYGYIGTGYHGLQQNREEKTIERDLFQALEDARLINYGDNVCNLGKIAWMQASRTDTGVHACAQILTFRAFLNKVKVKEVAQLVQDNLPEDSSIVVWASTEVGKAFSAQKYAEYRTYNYLMPVYAFGNADLNHIRKDFCPCFIGERNYHNFTKRINKRSQSAMRTITDFTFSDPFEIKGEKFVLFTIRGKSFMMNQIRKMLDVVLAYAHNLVDKETFERFFTLERWAINKVPGTGLMLDRVEYPGFRKKSGIKNPVKDVEFEWIRPDIQKWKEEVLFTHIADTIKKGDIFNTWINNALLPYPPKLLDQQEL